MKCTINFWDFIEVRKDSFMFSPSFSQNQSANIKFLNFINVSENRNIITNMGDTNIGINTNTRIYPMYKKSAKSHLKEIDRIINWLVYSAIHSS